MVLKATKLKQVAIVAVIALATVLVAVPAPRASATSCTATYLSWGSSGQCVWYLQDMLNTIGSYVGYANWHYLTLDSQFGSLTDGQVRAFQSYKGIGVDGVVGPITWNRLCTTGHSVVNTYWPSKGVLGLQDDLNALAC